MHIHQFPSLLDIIIMDEPHGEILVQIIFYSSSSYNYLFTLFSSITNYLYNPIFGNRESNDNKILCSSFEVDLNNYTIKSINSHSTIITFIQIMSCLNIDRMVYILHP